MNKIKNMPIPGITVQNRLKVTPSAGKSPQAGLDLQENSNVQLKRVMYYTPQY